MDYLSKFGKVRNSTAGLLLFVAWYISAGVTFLVLQDYFAEAARYMAIIFVCVLVFFSCAYAASRFFQRVDVVDVAWGPSFLVAMGTAFVISPYSLTFGLNIQTLVAILVTIWALRLSYSIGSRLVRTTEDKRYIELRKHWKGNLALNTYMRIFVLQAVLVTVTSVALVYIGVSSTAQMSILGYVGAAVWTVGFLFEAIGDKQLKHHLQKADQRGRLLKTGLRRLTRHPSYFGESVMWWGIFIVALSASYGWVAIITPVIITYLLLFVSGVPLAEESMRKKPGWHEYQRRTSVFFPLPPKE